MLIDRTYYRQRPCCGFTQEYLIRIRIEFNFIVWNIFLHFNCANFCLIVRQSVEAHAHEEAKTNEKSNKTLVTKLTRSF